MPTNNWVDANVVSASLALSTKAAMKDAEILVGVPSEWLSLLVPGEKRICSSFDECMIPFHECLFTRLKLWFPFSKFEVAILKYLKVALP